MQQKSPVSSLLSLLVLSTLALAVPTSKAAEIAIYNTGNNEQLREREVNLQATVAAKKGEMQLEIQNRQEEVEAKKEEVRAKAEEKKQEVFDKIREQTLTHIDRLINHLQTIQEKIKSTPNFEESEKQNAVDNLGNLINQLTELKSQVESAQSLEDLRTIRQNIHTVWQEIRLASHKHVGQIISGRFRHFMNRMEQAATRLEKHLGALAEKGVDVTAAENALADFKKALAAAQAKAEQAKTYFDQGNFTDGMQLMREAKQDLHQAGTNLRAAVQALKSQIDNQSETLNQNE